MISVGGRRRGRRTSTDDICRSWSNGRTAASAQPAASAATRVAAGDSPQGDVERVAADRAAALADSLVAQQAQAQRFVDGRPSGPSARMKLIRPFGQRAGLVGEQHVDVAEVLDADQALHQHLAPGQLVASRRPGWSRRPLAAAAG